MLKRFLTLFSIWLTGFTILLLKFYSPLNAALQVSNLLIIFWIAVPVLIILFKGYNEWYAIFFLLLFTVSLRLIPVLSDGNSAFVVFRDPIYNFSLSQAITDAGRWIPYQVTTASPINDMIFTPALNVLSVMLSQVLGLDLYTVCRFLPPIVFSVTITIFLFKTFKRLLGSYIAVLSTFVFVLCYKYNTFDSQYVQESLGIVFFVIALYALVEMTNRKGASKRAHSIIFILAVSSLAWTHFLSGLIFLIFATIVVVISSNKFFSGNFSINKVDFMIVATTFLGWVLFVATFFIYVSVDYLRYFLIQLPTIILHPTNVVSNQSLTGIVLSPIESAFAYSGLLIIVLLGALGFLGLLANRKKRPNHAISWLRIFGIVSFILGVILVVGLRGLKQSDVAYRFLPFFYIFISPLCALGVNYIRTRMKTIHFGKLSALSLPKLAVVILMLLPVLSVGLLIPSFLGGSVKSADYETVVSSKFLSAYSNKNSIVVGETTLAEPIAVYANLTYWSEYDKAILGNQTITDILYYGGNITALVSFLQNNGNFVFIVNKHFIDYKEYLLKPSTQNRPPSTSYFNSALSSINKLPFLDKVYDGESASVYISPEKNTK